MSRPTIIHAELRQWSRKGKKIIGKVFNDVKENFFDGEEVTILLMVELQEASNHYVAITDNYNFRLDKSQEVK